MTVTALEDQAPGCPSGLQEALPLETDPLAGALDLSAYVTAQKDGLKALELSVRGAHCAGCVAKIERGLMAVEGIKTAHMNLTSARLNVSWKEEKQTPKDIVAAITALGFGVTPFAYSQTEIHHQNTQKKLLRYIAVSGFAAMNIMMLSIAVWSGGSEMNAETRHLFHWISALIALPTIAYAGRAFFSPALQALKQKQTNMDVPISLALILASALSLYETIMGNQDVYFDAAVMLLFLLLIGRYLDTRLRLKTGEAARQLSSLQVTTATRLDVDGTQETLPAQALKLGDMILIPMGQRIPIDCRIESGESQIDMQIATGETQFKQVKPGDDLLSGTINVGRPLKAIVIARMESSFLAEITQLVEIGDQEKSKFVRIADRAARAYVPVVHTIAALTFLGWIVISGDLRMASINAIAVLIITCPCALGLAVPAVHAVAAGKLFEQGVYAKSGDALERLAKIDHIVFDKTGTLTTGKFTLLNPEHHDPVTLGLVGAIADYSAHPLSKAFKPYSNQSVLTGVEERAGLGLSAHWQGQTIKFGSAKFVGAQDIEIQESSVWLQIDDMPPMAFLLSDSLREDAGDTIKALFELGLTQEMLTGDNAVTAENIANALDLKNWTASITPKGKMEAVERHIRQGKRALMVGDGINDAPALACATASVSLASASDISRTAADIIMQNNKLSSLPFAVKIARNAHKRVTENLALAILYNMLAIPLAIFGLVNPLIAALAMSGSSLIVTLNALRVNSK